MFTIIRKALDRLKPVEPTYKRNRSDDGALQQTKFFGDRERARVYDQACYESNTWK